MRFRKFLVQTFFSRTSALFSAHRSDILTITFLILLPPVFFWRETLGWLTLGDQDALFWFLPVYKLVAEQIRDGQLPLWNPYMYSGMPLFAQLQAGVLDPVNWVYLFGATSRTLTLAQEISFAIALLSSYGYARSLGWKRRACVVSAIIYAFSGFAVARTIYPGLLHIHALTPLPLLFIERLYQRNNSGIWRSVIPGSLVVAWQIFAGHPQPFLYASLLAGSYALFCAFFRPMTGGATESRLSGFSRLRFLLQCLWMYVAGVMLSAVQMLPALEFARESVRREWSYEMFTEHSLHPVSLLTTIFPFFQGGGKGIYHLPFWGNYWHHNEAQIYLGTLTLSLALTGCFCAWRTGNKILTFWSVVAVVAILLALGKYVPPLAHLVYQIPGLNGFRSPNRHWMEVTLAIALLAGFAVENLLLADGECHRGKMIARTAAVSAGVVTILCVVVGLIVLSGKGEVENAIRSFADLHQLPVGFLQQAGSEFSVPLVTSLISLLTVGFFIHRRWSRHSYLGLLFLLMADFNLYAAFAPINSLNKPELFMGKAVPQEISTGFSENPAWRFHVVHVPGTGDFAPDWFYGHEMITGYDPLINARYKTFSGIDEAGHSYLPSPLAAKDQTLDLLNVRYVFVPPGLWDDGSGSQAAAIRDALQDTERWRLLTNLKPEDGTQSYRIYENQRALPRAWIVDQVETAFAGDQLKIMRGDPVGNERLPHKFDPRKVVLIEPGLAEQTGLNQVTPESEGRSHTDHKILDLRRTVFSNLTVQVTTDKPAMLVISLVDYPGWQAVVDGVRIRTLSVNYLLQGIPLQPGWHEVELVYLPNSLISGGLLSAGGFFLLFMLLLLEWMGIRIA